MITRRDMIAGMLLTPFVVSPAVAIGLPAGPEAYRSLDGLTGLMEGSGAGIAHILFTPWCSAVPGMFVASRSILSSLRLRWIPYSGSQPEGREASEILLRNGDPSLIPAAYVAMHQADTRQPTPLCDKQDAYMAKVVEPIIIRDVGGAIKIPTVIYRTPDGRVRILGGDVSKSDFAGIALAAS
jgi:hypothetical protein